MDIYMIREYIQLFFKTYHSLIQPKIPLNKKKIKQD